MWTVLSLLKKAEQYFKEKRIHSPRLEAEILLSHTLSMDRVSLYAHYKKPVNPHEVDRFRGLVKDRVNGTPTAYLIGTKEFFSLPFFVSKQVLIPRPETEDVVQSALDHLPKDGQGLRVADIGTGSGCIIITLLKLKPKLSGVGVDISSLALNTARENAEFHGVESRLKLLEGDLCEPLLAQKEGGAYRVITCNPPYVDPEGPVPYDAEVKDSEPNTAVFSPPGDPFYCYKRVLEQAGKLLDPQGLLIFEMGMGMSEKLCKMAEAEGFRVAAVKKDLAWIDRVICLSL